MLYLVVHIFIHPDQAEGFQTYEKTVLPIFKSHGGIVIGAFRPDAPSPTSNVDLPYEIHILSIPSEEAFLAYRQDPGVVGLMEERQRVIRKMDLFKSTQSIVY